MSKVNIMAKVIEIAEKRDKQVELSKEEIALGLVQDIAKITSSIQKAADDLEKLRDALDSDSDKRDAGVDVYNKAEKAAKELGLTVNDIKGIKELEKAVSDLDADYDEAKADFVNAPF